MRIRTNVKAGGIRTNRCETVKANSLKVRTGVKAGGLAWNRCETVRRPV